ncbi:MAG: DUF3500 domain-containing protein [Opitutus sp.]
MRHPRRLGFLVLFFSLVVSSTQAHAPATDMLAAANSFLTGISPEQKAKATYPLTDKERENWNFVPLARAGLPLKEMTSAQQDLAMGLLRTGLSHQGSARAEAIMAMENVLKALENGAARRDPTLYYVTIFGTPAADATWGWRFEGHHLSFNFTVFSGSHVYFTPSFIGSNPGEVRSGPKLGLRVLAEEDDQGRALIQSLDENQRRIAIFDTKAPGEIITANQHRVTALSPVGIAASALNANQRDALVALTKLYLNRCRSELAEAKWTEMSSHGLDQLTFAWAGGVERGEANYYRIQSPTCLIEFDNSQNQANHIHTVVRDFKGDFGHDLLAEHYAEEHKK